MFWDKKNVEIIKTIDADLEKNAIIDAVELVKKRLVFDKTSFNDEMPAESLLANLLIVQLMELRRMNTNLEALLTRK